MKMTRVSARAVGAVALSAVLSVSACSGGDPGNLNHYSFTSFTQLGRLIPVGQREKAENVGGGLMSGGSTTLSKAAGQVRLVNFFASWCEPCQIETPQLAKFAAINTKTSFLGIDVDDDRGSAKTFLSQSGVSYPVVFDQASRVPLRLGNIPAKLPFTVLIDKSGRVAAVYAGALTVADLRPPLRVLANQR